MLIKVDKKFNALFALTMKATCPLPKIWFGGFSPAALEEEEFLN